MFLKVRVHCLISISQIFYVSPGPVDFGPTDFPTDEGVLTEIGIVDISVVAEQEGAKV